MIRAFFAAALAVAAGIAELHSKTKNKTKGAMQNPNREPVGTNQQHFEVEVLKNRH